MAESSGFLSCLDDIASECGKVSRTTVHGTVSTEAAAKKNRHIQRGLPAATVQAAATGNIRSAVEHLASSRSLQAEQLPGLIVAVNRELTKNVSASPGAFRDFDSDRFPYLPARLIREFFAEFAIFLSDALASSNPSDSESAVVFGRIHWDLNVYGHVFADGCGRTATVLAAWAYWRGQRTIPRLPSRGEYLSLAGAGGRDEFIGSLAARLADPRPSR